MKKITKRIFAAIIVVCMILTLIPVHAISLKANSVFLDTEYISKGEPSTDSNANIEEDGDSEFELSTALFQEEEEETIEEKLSNGMVNEEDIIFEEGSTYNISIEWNDNNNEYNVRPSEVIISKNADVINESNDWKISEILAEEIEIQDINYYNKFISINDNSCLITYNIDETMFMEIYGHKLWKDKDGKNVNMDSLPDYMVPSSVEIYLKKNGETVKTETISAENDWEYNFGIVPIDQLDSYSIEEESLEWWSLNNKKLSGGWIKLTLDENFNSGDDAAYMNIYFEDEKGEIRKFSKRWYTYLDEFYDDDIEDWVEDYILSGPREIIIPSSKAWVTWYVKSFNDYSSYGLKADIENISSGDYDILSNQPSELPLNHVEKDLPIETNHPFDDEGDEQDLIWSIKNTSNDAANDIIGIFEGTIIEGTKKWFDTMGNEIIPSLNSNEKIVIPDSITVVLKKDGIVQQRQTISEETNWKYYFIGKGIGDYTVEEENTPEGWEEISGKCSSDNLVGTKITSHHTDFGHIYIFFIGEDGNWYKVSLGEGTAIIPSTNFVIEYDDYNEDNILTVSFEKTKIDYIDYNEFFSEEPDFDDKTIHVLASGETIYHDNSVIMNSYPMYFVNLDYDIHNKLEGSYIRAYINWDDGNNRYNTRPENVKIDISSGEKKESIYVSADTDWELTENLIGWSDAIIDSITIEGYDVDFYQDEDWDGSVLKQEYIIDASLGDDYVNLRGEIHWFDEYGNEISRREELFNNPNTLAVSEIPNGVTICIKKDNEIIDYIYTYSPMDYGFGTGYIPKDEIDRYSVTTYINGWESSTYNVREYMAMYLTTENYGDGEAYIAYLKDGKYYKAGILYEISDEYEKGQLFIVPTDIKKLFIIRNPEITDNGYYDEEDDEWYGTHPHSYVNSIFFNETFYFNETQFDIAKDNYLKNVEEIDEPIISENEDICLTDITTKYMNEYSDINTSYTIIDGYNFNIQNVYQGQSVYVKGQKHWFDNNGEEISQGINEIVPNDIKLKLKNGNSTLNATTASLDNDYRYEFLTPIKNIDDNLSISEGTQKNWRQIPFKTELREIHIKMTFDGDDWGDEDDWDWDDEKNGYIDGDFEYFNQENDLTSSEKNEEDYVHVIYKTADGELYMFNDFIGKSFEGKIFLPGNAIELYFIYSGYNDSLCTNGPISYNKESIDKNELDVEVLLTQHPVQKISEDTLNSYIDGAIPGYIDGWREKYFQHWIFKDIANQYYEMSSISVEKEIDGDEANTSKVFPLTLKNDDGEEINIIVSADNKKEVILPTGKLYVASEIDNIPGFKNTDIASYWNDLLAQKGIKIEKSFFKLKTYTMQTAFFTNSKLFDENTYLNDDEYGKVPIGINRIVIRNLKKPEKPITGEEYDNGYRTEYSLQNYFTINSSPKEEEEELPDIPTPPPFHGGAE